MLKLHRLLPSDRLSWMWWPEYEKRVLGFLDAYSTHLNAAQREQFVTELRNRFSTTPQLSGYWLIFNGKDAFEQQVVGHLCGWINVQYGRPYVLLFQTEVDVAFEGREVLLDCMKETGEWIGGVNRELAEKKQPLIDYVEAWVLKSVEAWKRWLPELDIVKSMTIMRIAIPGRESANSKHLVQ